MLIATLLLYKVKSHGINSTKSGIMCNICGCPENVHRISKCTGICAGGWDFSFNLINKQSDNDPNIQSCFCQLVSTFLTPCCDNWRKCSACITMLFLQQYYWIFVQNKNITWILNMFCNIIAIFNVSLPKHWVLRWIMHLCITMYFLQKHPGFSSKTKQKHHFCISSGTYR